MIAFQKLIFPLEVDYAGGYFWIGAAGPFPCGSAIAVFLGGHNLTDDNAEYQVLRNYFQDVVIELPIIPFSKKIAPCHCLSAQRELDEQFLSWHSILPEDTAITCESRFAYCKDSSGKLFPVQRSTFYRLFDFLYMDLGCGLQRDNYPQRCQLCGQWFLHLNGEKYLYCERIAPGETERTCREVGANAYFQKKVQENEIWFIYKRAYKKYYARVLKKTMDRTDFDVWAKQMLRYRDAALREYQTVDEEQRCQLVERLRRQLNGR